MPPSQQLPSELSPWARPAPSSAPAGGADGITDEQRQIVESRSPFLRVNAFAGSGKTTTLVAYAKARPRERMLYLAFNKGIQLEAERKFPGHVRCVTSHAMAFPQFGSRYAHKLVDKIRVNQAASALAIQEYPEHFQYYVADAAMKLLGRFLASDAEGIEERMTTGLVLPDSGATPSDIVMCARKLWSRMCDPADTGVGMVHDGYLKLYQLSRPRLSYDRILFDEAQDANPVTAALVDAQQAGKVVVGDAHQAIYAFRLAINAMRKFKADQTLYLTRSFRFGQPIADVANLILSSYKDERRSIVGNGPSGSIGPLPAGKPYAVISRTNAALFEEAITAQAAGKRIHFVGGIQGYRLGEVLDTYHLWSGSMDRIASPFIRAFKDFSTAENYAGLSDDKELKSLLHVVRRHSSKVPLLVNKIRSGAVDSADQAQVFLTTAHKSKGLEWEHVRLTDDYMDLFDQYRRPRKLDFQEEEEANILYVAATRARRSLQPFAELGELIQARQAKERSEKLPAWARPVAWK